MGSAICTVATNVSVAADGTIPAGTIVRRLGCRMGVEGDAIALSGRGYYRVSVSATLLPDAAGALGIMLNKDGVAVPGATSMGTGTTNSPLALAFTTIVRQTQCGTSTITVGLDSDGTTTGAVVENCVVCVDQI